MPSIRKTTSVLLPIPGSCRTCAIHPGHSPTRPSTSLFARTSSKTCANPITVCRELCRVGKAGYIETPSRIREIFSKEKQFFARYLLGNFPEIGFHHHRWFVEIEGTHLRFTAKTAALPADRRYYITRGDIGRNLTEQESGLGFFWHEGFTFGEAFVDHDKDYPAFRCKAIARLKS